MRVRKDLTVILVAAVLVVAAAPMFAAQGEGPGFVQELLGQLAADGWSAQETQALSDAAASLDWSGSQGVNPQVVALALELAKSREQSLTGPGEAEIALQLALAAAQMKAVGFDDHAAASAALGGVQVALSSIQSWIAGGRQGNLGQIIRRSVAEAVHSQLNNPASSQFPGGGSGLGGNPGLAANAPIVPPGLGGPFPPNNPRK